MDLHVRSNRKLNPRFSCFLKIRLQWKRPVEFLKKWAFDQWHPCFVKWYFKGVIVSPLSSSTYDLVNDLSHQRRLKSAQQQKLSDKKEWQEKQSLPFTHIIMRFKDNKISSHVSLRKKTLNTNKWTYLSLTIYKYQLISQASHSKCVQIT